MLFDLMLSRFVGSFPAWCLGKEVEFDCIGTVLIIAMVIFILTLIQVKDNKSAVQF